MIKMVLKLESKCRQQGISRLLFFFFFEINTFTFSYNTMKIGKVPEALPLDKERGLPIPVNLK